MLLDLGKGITAEVTHKNGSYGGKEYQAIVYIPFTNSEGGTKLKKYHISAFDSEYSPGQVFAQCLDNSFLSEGKGIRGALLDMVSNLILDSRVEAEGYKIMTEMEKEEKE